MFGVLRPAPETAKDWHASLVPHPENLKDCHLCRDAAVPTD